MYIYKVIFNSNMLSRIDSEAPGKPLRSFYELISFLNNIKSSIIFTRLLYRWNRINLFYNNNHINI